MTALYIKGVFDAAVLVIVAISFGGPTAAFAGTACESSSVACNSRKLSATAAELASGRRHAQGHAHASEGHPATSRRHLRGQQQPHHVVSAPVGGANAARLTCNLAFHLTTDDSITGGDGPVYGFSLTLLRSCHASDLTCTATLSGTFVKSHAGKYDTAVPLTLHKDYPLGLSAETGLNADGIVLHAPSTGRLYKLYGSAKFKVYGFHTDDISTPSVSTYEPVPLTGKECSWSQ
ncbi:hypothetical protein HYH03_007650 [Edaphochlamys debaryana]|uniref:Uncharacterized protein n=1 Tax=Edaphochlamys debaryana TaxID=47281 RepID=A0A835Y0A7_9CHLO|nr:hypothetical protein HYH03_007650 [Edaphochlamys debaryana]|eukprot:KAG2494297.1 hypothetical protein HYH03_007650 [Edaphochlamys debaryana]